jgi:RsiW-degrading membrane proteinase PrsW (M82 family)
MELLGVLLGLFFVVPFVVVYVVFIRWCDRFEPEPWWLLLCAFFFGALVATAGGGTMNGLSQTLASIVTGLPPQSEDIQGIVATFSAPIFEEGFKGLGVAMIAAISAMGVKELDGPLDGAIYGGVVGLGFTLTEDVEYVSNAFVTDGFGGLIFLWFIRTVLNGLTHCTFTAMTGLGFGIASESRSWLVKIAAPLGGYVLAMAMHGFHNGILTIGEEGFFIMQGVNWIIDIVFFVMLALLVARDRRIIIRELADEVGGLLHPRELVLITTYMQIGLQNWGALFSRGWSAFRARRRKQLALVEVAFIKNRRRRGETGRDLDAEEAKLRQEIALANRQGVWLGGT